MRRAWGIACALLAGTAAAAGALAAGRVEGRPNLLLILSDDQRWDTLGSAGNRVIRTPHLDALAAEGVRFRSAFVTTPICAASRASVLTGLYERTHRFTFATPPLSAAHADLSYPTRLRAAGYRTGFSGKLGITAAPGAVERMFDRFVPLNRTPYLKPQPGGGVRHLTDIETDRAIEFLESCPPEQPFCLSVSFNAPHAEDNDPRQFIWAAAEDGLYEEARWTPPRTMAPAFFQAHPEFLRNTESRVRYHWRFDEPEKYQRMLRGYYRMITGVDRCVGRLREALARLGRERNTVILFSSDNGFFLGERGFADKWYGYEHSIRVPLLVHDPRLPARRRGSVEGRMALNVDFAPTLLDLAGITPPAEMQGRSLVPLLRGRPPADWRKDFFFEHLFERGNIPKSEGVRTERWTYLRWFEQQPVVEELYDHRADFEQERNLALRREHRETLERFRRRTDLLRDQYGGIYVRPPAATPARTRPRSGETTKQADDSQD